MEDLIKQIFEIIIGWTIIIFIIIKIIKRKKNNISNKINNIEISNNIEKKEKLITETEKNFYNMINQICKKYELIIFTQVALNQIIKPKDIEAFKQIGAKSIDFVITDKNGNIKFCIELDDNTHNQEKRIKRDKEVNHMFKSVGIKLLRIPIEQAFIIERIEKQIKESL